QRLSSGKGIEVAFRRQETRIPNGLRGDALDLGRRAGRVDHGPDVEVLELTTMKGPRAQLGEQCIDMWRLNPGLHEAFHPRCSEPLPRRPLCFWPERAADVDHGGLQVGHRRGW